MIISSYNNEKIDIKLYLSDTEIYEASSQAEENENGLMAFKIDNAQRVKDSVLGSICCKSTDITIVDQSGYFASRENFDKLKAGQKLEVYVADRLKYTFRLYSFGYEINTVGTDIDIQVGNLTLGAFDCLNDAMACEIANRDIRTQTVQGYITSVLKEGKISEDKIIFDTNLSKTIVNNSSYGTVSRALNDICRSEMLAVYVDSNENVHIDNMKFTATKAEYNISFDQLMPPLNINYADRGSIDDIDVVYNNNSISNDTILIKEFDAVLKTGYNWFYNQVLDLKTAGIDRVHVITDTTVNEDGLEVNFFGTSDKITIAVKNNTGAEVEATIRVYGRVLTIETKTEVSTDSKNKATVTSNTIQTEEDAQKFKENAKTYIEQSKQVQTLKTVVGFDAEVGDMVNITNADETEGIKGLSTLDSIFRIDVIMIDVSSGGYFNEIELTRIK